MRRLLLAAVVALVAILQGSADLSTAGWQSAGNAFVTRRGAELTLDGRPFHFVGTNTYYLMYKSRFMVDAIFAGAKAAGFNTVRTWGFLDIGDQDGSRSVRGIQEDTYFQYWDGAGPAYNDGPTGLEKLDYVLYSARRAGIKLVIALTNNWNDFGGMDQYVRWRGGSYHDEFYTDPVIRGWYKNWVTHVLTRVNTLTGVAYADDPTVAMWELANEPRCLSADAYPRSPQCTTQTLTAWADEMTRHIKSMDTRHLVSVGDEGFFCDYESDAADASDRDWTRTCGEGVDTVALARLPAVDVMSYHLYPSIWDKDLPWTYDWISRHVREAKRIGKPSMLGEFGWPDKATRNTVYRTWTDIVTTAGGTGWLYWLLAGAQDDGTRYGDFDGFTVYCPSPVCTTLSHAGAELVGRRGSPPPVADHDTATVDSNQAASLFPAANDVAFHAAVRPDSIDLDPAAAGRQTTVSVPSGVFTLGALGAVRFEPTAGFAGTAVAHYTIEDDAGRVSNDADITVTVRPTA